MEQREYWDSVSEKKQFTTPFHAESFSKYVNPNVQILDVGCGYGRTLDELYHTGYRNLTKVLFTGIRSLHVRTRYKIKKNEGDGNVSSS